MSYLSTADVHALSTIQKLNALQWARKNAFHLVLLSNVKIYPILKMFPWEGNNALFLHCCATCPCQQRFHGDFTSPTTI